MNTIKDGSHRTLQHLLEYAFDAEATDARDYVFSIVALAVDVTDQHDTLKPDYRKPVRQVFEDVARFLFVEHDCPSLLLLGRAGIGYTDRKRNLPSWIPDPSEQRMSTPHNQIAIRRTFQTCGPHHTKVQSQIATPGILRLKGFPCETLRAVSAVDLVAMECEPGARHPALPLIRKKLTYLLSNMLFVQQHTGSDASNVNEQMYRIFVVDHMEDKRVTDEHKQVFTDLLQLYIQLADSKDYMDMVRRSDAAVGHNIWAPVLPSPESHSNREVMAYNGAFTSACIGRRMAVTSAGRCCLVPIMSQPGDQIFIPCGSVAPYVIRHDDDANTVQLVGEAYVHGIMYGEAVNEQSEAVWLAFR